MARINGVEIKSLKGFRGHEGYCYQGNVYLNGKKLGFWSQDSWGGPDEFDFDDSVLDEACKRYKEGFPDEYEYKDFCDSKEIFLHAVLNLKLHEQDCKPEYKKGAKSVYLMTDGFHCSWMGFYDVPTIEDVHKNYPTQVKEMESGMFKNGFSEHIFTPESFDMTIDNTHPAPGFFMV